MVGKSVFGKKADKKTGWLRQKPKGMRSSKQEKVEIINLVEGSDLPLRRTIKELSISKSTFHSLYSAYPNRGQSGLEPMRRNR